MKDWWTNPNGLTNENALDLAAHRVRALKGDYVERIQVKPVFVKTRNVKEFEAMMQGLELSAGEGRLGLIYGSAGRGKTRTAEWFAANNDCIFLRAATVWSTSPLEFLKALCVECGIKRPPSRKGACYSAVIDVLVRDSRPVFIDEIEKLHRSFLDIVRDLSDMTGSAFVLIGEDELEATMKINKRVWSRTYCTLPFGPIDRSDIIYYYLEACGLKLSGSVAAILHRSSEGDFRLVRRDMLALVQLANARRTREVDDEMAKLAVKVGLRGGNGK